MVIEYMVIALFNGFFFAFYGVNLYFTGRDLEGLEAAI